MQINKEIKLDLSYWRFPWAVWNCEGQKLACLLERETFKKHDTKVLKHTYKSAGQSKRQRPPFSRWENFRCICCLTFWYWSCSDASTCLLYVNMKFQISKLITPLSFYLYKHATKKFRITYVAHIAVCQNNPMLLKNHLYFL